MAIWWNYLADCWRIFWNLNDFLIRELCSTTLFFLSLCRFIQALLLYWFRRLQIQLLNHDKWNQFVGTLMSLCIKRLISLSRFIQALLLYKLWRLKVKLLNHDKWNQILVLMTGSNAEHPVSNISLKAE